MELSGNIANLIFTYDVTTQAAGIAPTQFSRTINLRNVIGEQEYDKADFFQMSFNNYSASNFFNTIYTETLGDLPTSTPVRLGVSGLPFINNSSNGQISNFALFPPIFQVTGTTTTTLNSSFRAGNFPYATKRAVKFRKPQNPDVTLTFAFYSIREINTPVYFSTVSTPIDVSQILCFSIMPISSINM